MPIHNPYAKKRPPSDHVTATTASEMNMINSLYRPSTSLIPGMNHVVFNNARGSVGNTAGSKNNNGMLLNTSLLDKPLSGNENCTGRLTSAFVSTNSNSLEHINARTVTTGTSYNQDVVASRCTNPDQKARATSIIDPKSNLHPKKQKQIHPAVSTTGITPPSASGDHDNNVISKQKSAPQSTTTGNHSVPAPIAKQVAMASMRPDSWKLRSTGNGKIAARTCATSSELASVATPNLKATQQSQQHPTDIEDTKADGLPPELRYCPQDVKPIQDKYRLQLIQNANLSAPLLNGWVLYPHQKKALVRSLTMRRMILALDMGLGKTVIGAVWSKAFKQTFERLKVFVVCPVSLREEWKRTAEEKIGLTVEEENSRKKKPMRCSSSDDDNDDDDSGFKMKICSWAKIPIDVEPEVRHFVVCCDEAHSMQSAQAKRTQDILKLVKDNRCVGVLLLTGTPMKNGKPSNLFPLLKAVRHPLGRHQKAFEKHFCNGMLKNFGNKSVWDASGCSNLEQLKTLISSNLLHMTKEQCLEDLPPMTSANYDVPVSSRFQIQYDRAIKDWGRIQANANQLGDDAILGAIQRVRVVCALAKADATVNLARKILNDQPAVVVFTSFIAVAKDIHNKLSGSGWPCELLTGETPQKKRQELVDRFQSGFSSVFICTFGAGGVGLTLTAACTVILVDRPWTPGDVRQAEDRIRRIGQKKPCKSYWLCSFEVDRQIDTMLVSKNETTNAVLYRNQDSTESALGQAEKLSIQKVAKSFFLSDYKKVSNNEKSHKALG